jgi:cytochrome c peroxidase
LRGDLTWFIANQTAAIQLGKALFWDIQAGSDNKVSCATCHFQAGADVRTRNQLNPGANGSLEVGSTNYTLSAANFPFVDPLVGRNEDDISGSQGVRKSTFGGVDATGVETITPASDPLFGNMRRTTGLNTPSTVNAVFNHRTSSTDARRSSSTA